MATHHVCKIKTATLATMLVILSGVTGAATAQEPADQLLTAMRRAGVAKIAVATLLPYATLSPNGQPEGYTIDISALAMQGLGVPKLSATVTTWDAMIPGLQARQFDFVPAGLSITTARCKAVLFSSPITAQQDALYVLPGNPKRLTGYTSVAQAPDVQLAVLVGSVQEAYALKQGIKPAQLLKVPDAQAGIATVIGGRAQAFAVGQFSVPNPEQKGVEVVIDKSSPVAAVGVAFRKENAQTRDAFNKQLEILRANGAMKDLYIKWGLKNWETLARVTKTSDVASGCE